ncbi:hypothetical protein lerEdw1_008071 [Lerista edwardsae]|nr:hypothetical protein lerEdw1_008071 [Lerista edwardsae]
MVDELLKAIRQFLSFFKMKYLNIAASFLVIFTYISISLSLHASIRGYFQDLLNKSEKALYETFPGLYGDLYAQNVKVFKDLYNELRRYYRGSNINLEEALNEFWTRLLERLFKLMNPQYYLPDEYVDCMMKHSEQHKPFGEVPRDLKLKATRAFIAVRSFVQGLGVGSDVVKKVSQVFQGCGNPKINPKPSNVEDKKRRMKAISEDKPSGLGLEKLVSDAKGKLRDMRDFWVALPTTLCNEKVLVLPKGSTGSLNEDKCWNGMTKSRYLPDVMGDGLANQINNPEVEVDITKPDMTIRQQIMQLKIMTNRLRNAYNGNDVDFQDTSDDISGSGSGDGCLDEVCGKRLSKNPSPRPPNTYPMPKQSGQGNGGNSSSILLPSSLLLLLSLAAVVTQSLWR